MEEQARFALPLSLPLLSLSPSSQFRAFSPIVKEVIRKRNETPLLASTTTTAAFGSTHSERKTNAVSHKSAPAEWREYSVFELRILRSHMNLSTLTSPIPLSTKWSSLHQCHRRGDRTSWATYGNSAHHEVLIGAASATKMKFGR